MIRVTQLAMKNTTLIMFFALWLSYSTVAQTRAAAAAPSLPRKMMRAQSWLAHTVVKEEEEESKGMTYEEAFNGTIHWIGTSHDGWAIPTEPDFYQKFHAGEKFVVGDVLVFSFPTRGTETIGTHDVVEVTKAAYDSCTNSSKDVITKYFPEPTYAFVHLDLTTPGEHYYICTVSRQCSLGQKLAINVVPDASSPSPAPSSSPSNIIPAESSPAPSSPSSIFIPAESSPAPSSPPSIFIPAESSPAPSSPPSIIIPAESSPAPSSPPSIIIPTESSPAPSSLSIIIPAESSPAPSPSIVPKSASSATAPSPSISPEPTDDGSSDSHLASLASSTSYSRVVLAAVLSVGLVGFLLF